MAFRLHPATKYEIEYGTGYFHGYGIYNNINSLIKDNCEEVYINDDVDTCELEIYAKEFEEFVNRFLDKEERKIMLKKCDYLKWSEDTDFEEMAISFKELYDKADKSDKCIHLSWF